MALHERERRCKNFTSRSYAAVSITHCTVDMYMHIGIKGTGSRHRTDILKTRTEHRIPTKESCFDLNQKIFFTYVQKF